MSDIQEKTTVTIVQPFVMISVPHVEAELRLNTINDLRKQNYTIINPGLSRTDIWDSASRLIKYMRKADCVYFMRDWMYLPGTKALHNLALEEGMSIFYESPKQYAEHIDSVARWAGVIAESKRNDDTEEEVKVYEDKQEQ